MLEAYAISKNYGEVEALKDVDIQVEAGELFTLLGPSGCGKTTLLRIIAGLEKADKGTVYLNHLPVSLLPANERPIKYGISELCPVPAHELCRQCGIWAALPQDSGIRGQGQSQGRA